MCGICGIAFSARSRRQLDAPALVRMRDTMTHRGPDDFGIFHEGRVGLAYRRLSIIDVAGGHQPMHDDGGSLHIVYNGEIYNHQDLRVSLERRGHRYHTRCDTETLLRLYQEDGARAVDQLRGMFAFAVWDGRPEELCLARPHRGAGRDGAVIAEFRQPFTEAVRMRLMSDVPLGVFLSGGIDSASITAVMSRLVADPIKTFSVAFAEREANELAYARTVARAYRTDHHEVVVSPAEFFEALPTLVWHEDEPLAHPPSVALYFVSRLAADHVKVVLTGEGSDELLAGYGRYARTLFNVRWGTHYHRVLPASLRRAARRVVE